MTDTNDLDPSETREWLESVEDVIDRDGTDRAHFLLDQAVAAARSRGANLPFGSTTAYVNTIPPDQQPPYPGDLELEWRIRTINRWNAMATVVRRNKVSSEYGGHIASFASSAVLYDIGLNHFWRTRTDAHGGDLVFFQGHAIPGIYARSFMEGRLSAETLDNFRSETGGEGLSSYPHPWLMPDYWQFPTVSMGLGPLMAIYQARFMKYMHNRGHIDMADRKVWAFLGDGEMDEPESLGAIGLAAREDLDNLIFVVNCNGSTGRCAATRRSSRSSRATSAAPAGTSSSSSGARAGTSCSTPTTPASCASSWTRPSTATTRPSARRTAPTSASISSASTPRPRSSSRTGPTPRSGRCAAAATIRPRSTPPSTAR